MKKGIKRLLCVGLCILTLLSVASCVSDDPAVMLEKAVAKTNFKHLTLSVDVGADAYGTEQSIRAKAEIDGDKNNNFLIKCYIEQFGPIEILRAYYINETKTIYALFEGSWIKIELEALLAYAGVEADEIDAPDIKEAKQYSEKMLDLINLKYVGKEDGMRIIKADFTLNDIAESVDKLYPEIAEGEKYSDEYSEILGEEALNAEINLEFGVNARGLSYAQLDMSDYVNAFNGTLTQYEDIDLEITEVKIELNVIEGKDEEIVLDKDAEGAIDFLELLTKYNEIE